MGILDQTQQAEVAKNITHQHALLAEKMGYGYQNMSVLLKRDWKSAGMAKETMPSLLSRLQPYIAASKKDIGNRANTLIEIEKYERQAVYKRFCQINKILGSDKFFC